MTFNRSDEELKAEIALETKLQELFHQTIADVAEASIDRIRDSAKYVQVSATAVQAIYAGILGLVFAADGKPLPIRGVLPAAFLAVSIVLATAFLSFLPRPRSIELWGGALTVVDNQIARSFFLGQWAQSAYLRRRSLLQAATVALAVGVAMIPLPFLTPANAPAAAAAVEPPSIPQAIPGAIEESAVQVFEAQADAYLESTGTIEPETADSACPGNKPPLIGVFWQCAWDDSEAEMNAASMSLAVWGLILVVGVPLVAWIAGWRRKSSV